MSDHDQISGGPIRHHKEGWAKFCFGGMKAHWWVEDTKTMPEKIGAGGRVRYYESLCGELNAADNKFPALHPGSWDKCKRCARKLA